MRSTEGDPWLQGSGILEFPLSTLSCVFVLDGCHRSCAVGCTAIKFPNGAVVPRGDRLACTTLQVGKTILTKRRCTAGFKPVPWLHYGCYGPRTSWRARCLTQYYE